MRVVILIQAEFVQSNLVVILGDLCNIGSVFAKNILLANHRVAAASLALLLYLKHPYHSRSQVYFLKYGQL